MLVVVLLGIILEVMVVELVVNCNIVVTGLVLAVTVGLMLEVAEVGSVNNETLVLNF